MKKYHYANYEGAEDYYAIGEFADDATKQDAAKRFFEKHKSDLVVYIPDSRPPMSPEEAFSSSDFVEAVVCDDDYCMDCSEFDIPKELEKPFEDAVRKTIRDFLELHNLMPTHFVCENAEKFERPIGM